MRKFLLKIFVVLILLVIVASSFIFLIGYGFYSDALHDKSLTERVESVTNKDHFTKYEDLSKNYVNAVIAVEDRRFYDHGAVDFIAVVRALYTNITEGNFDEGGSTITQQVAKNIIFNQEKRLRRKIGEVFGAFDLEKNYTKNEILALYVNTNYFGDGYYGIYEASRGYYNKDPKDLNLNEASMLAGIPNAPSIYSPTVNPDLAKKRQSHVLNKMVECGYITQDEADIIKE